MYFAEKNNQWRILINLSDTQWIFHEVVNIERKKNYSAAIEVINLVLYEAIEGTTSLDQRNHFDNFEIWMENFKDSSDCLHTRSRECNFNRHDFIIIYSVTNEGQSN